MHEEKLNGIDRVVMTNKCATKLSGHLMGEKLVNVACYDRTT